MERETHKIDAQDKSLGRVAAKAAKILLGKHKPEFNPRQDRGDFVVIENVEQTRITGKKMAQKEYFKHSGFPGGVKKTSLKKMFEKSPQKVLKKAVWGMLPKNKLRTKRINRLKFK